MPVLWRGKGKEAASFLSWLVTVKSIKIKCQVYASVADGLWESWNLRWGCSQSQARVYMRKTNHHLEKMCCANLWINF